MSDSRGSSVTAVAWRAIVALVHAHLFRLVEADPRGAEMVPADQWHGTMRHLRGTDTAGERALANSQARCFQGTSLKSRLGECDLRPAEHVWKGVNWLLRSGGSRYEQHRAAVPSALGSRLRIPLSPNRRQVPSRGPGSGHIPSGHAVLPRMERRQAGGLAAHDRGQSVGRSSPSVPSRVASYGGPLGSRHVGPGGRRPRRPGDAEAASFTASEGPDPHTHLRLQPRGSRSHGWNHRWSGEDRGVARSRNVRACLPRRRDPR